MNPWDEYHVHADSEAGGDECVLQGLTLEEAREACVGARPMQLGYCVYSGIECYELDGL